MQSCKHIFRTALTAAALFCSCNRTEPVPVPVAEGGDAPQPEFFARIEEGPKTIWRVGDQICINGNPAYYACKLEEDGAWFRASAPFEGVADSDKSYEAFYPYTLGGEVLPSEQAVATDGGFRVPLRALSEDKKLSFKMLTGVLELKIKTRESSLELSRLTLSSSRPLSGPFEIGKDEEAVVDGKFGILTYSFPITADQTSTAVSFAMPQGSYSDLTLFVKAKNGSEAGVPIDGEIVIGRAETISREIVLDTQIFVPANCIYYYTTDGSVVTPYGLSPVTNTYEDGMGIMTFENELYTIPSHAFDGVGDYSPESAHLKRIFLPPSVKTFGPYAFQNCTSLEEFHLPENEEFVSLPANTFTGCTSLRELIVPDNVTKINNNALQNCTTLTRVRLPEGITAIPQNFFNGCSSLSEVNVPSALSTLGVKAFMGTAITSITLPAGLVSIPSQAFQNCPELRQIRLKRGQDEQWTELAHVNALSGCTSLEKIYVPEGSLERYKAAPGWSNYASLIYVEEN